MKEFFKRLLWQLGLKKSTIYLVRRAGNILGTYPGVSESHVLDNVARAEGHKSFAASGLSAEQHKLEAV